MKLKAGLQDQDQLVMASNALLRNMIILWNYLFCLTIDYLLVHKINVRMSLSISTGSVIDWAHINFMGIYELNPVVRSQFGSK
jgi:hypothetical protein